MYSYAGATTSCRGNEADRPLVYRISGPRIAASYINAFYSRTTLANQRNNNIIRTAFWPVNIYIYRGSTAAESGLYKTCEQLRCREIFEEQKLAVEGKIAIKPLDKKICGAWILLKYF